MIVFTLEVTAILTVAFFIGCMVGCLLARQTQARQKTPVAPASNKSGNTAKRRGKRKAGR